MPSPTTALAVLNVAVLLSALFFFTSTLASHALEALVGLLNSRGRQLRARLRAALGDEVAEEIYKSPLLRSLAGDGKGESPWRSPSYIEPLFFARAVAALHEDEGNRTAAQPLFLQLRREAERDGSSFEERVIEWYKAVGDRQTGAYTRWSTLRLFAIGFLLAAALDIDVVHVGASLWRRPEVADALARKLEDAVPELKSADPSTLGGIDGSRLADAVATNWQDIRAGAEPAAPYGWRKGPGELTRREWAGKLLGWLLTALATSFGAQFWFRLLSESLKLRASGRKPAASLPPPVPAGEASAAPAPTPPAGGKGSRASPAAARLNLVPPTGGGAGAENAPRAGEPPIGSLSSKHEVGVRGPGTVSSGTGDQGGVSYGSYQMTSEPEGGTVARFVGEAGFPWRDRFAGLPPGSPGFTACWKALAAEAPAAFHACQHAFIRRTHYDPLVRKTADEDGLGVEVRSNALKNVVWSTAVQHGPATRVIRNALAKLPPGVTRAAGPGFDRELIRAIYAERCRRDAEGSLAYFRRNSEAVQAGVAKRFAEEERDALRMLDDETSPPPRVEEAA